MQNKEEINRFTVNKVALSIVVICFALVNLGCRNISKMPQQKYELTEIISLEEKTISQKDTIILLEIGGGHLYGVEHNYYSIKKLNERTIVTRTSNFQKFQPIEITSLDFPWTYIVNNFEKFRNDTIKTEKKIINNDGSIMYQQAASHGKTTFLKVKLGEVEHKFYLGPLVDSYNEGNINLDLIMEIKAPIITLDYQPSARIKYKRER